MSQQLKLKYHPAKKEVEFTRFARGQAIAIRSDSVLTKYMSQKGTFVLQDHGNDFFEDIAEAFDGERTIHIDVVTTKSDYEDFEQMIEYYNGDPNSNAKITATLLAELPNMEDTYRMVHDFGQKSISVLSQHLTQLSHFPLDNPSVKSCVKIFLDDVLREIDNIKTKLDSMSDNHINLCFTGIYSSGKSALINAILGYRILPENIKSETARMFQIQSPSKGEKVRVTFEMQNYFTEIIWNDLKCRLEFAAGPVENKVRKSIQKVLDEHCQDALHSQLLALLQTFNTTDDAVGSHIQVFFPIPLDTEKTQFTIYDTPGTDSNYVEHRQILLDALSQQTHSILIFIAAPDRIEGEGNNALLSYLKTVEQKSNKTSIDIARSLFVINKADTISPTERATLQSATITDTTDKSSSIRLADKKLFFVSALYAFSAKATRNGIADEEDTYRIEDDYKKLFRPERGRYYQSDRVATSEFATKKLIERSEKRLTEAEEKDDAVGVIEVCSGLYALEREIVAYGEKYASSVRAFAIIDSVERALASMENSIKVLDQKSQEDLQKINTEIEEVRKTITTGIKTVGHKEKYHLSKNQIIPPELSKTLHLDTDYLNEEISGKVRSRIDGILKKSFFGIMGKIKVKEEDRKNMIAEINTVLNEYTHGFLEARQRTLEQLRDDFIAEIKEIIRKNGKISEEAKNFILDIRSPEIRRFNNSVEFGTIYDNNRRVKKILWIKTESIDKNGVLTDVDTKLSEILQEMTNDYLQDFRQTLEDVTRQIESEFTQNIEKYSVLMRTKLAAKETMEQLRKKIEEAARDLKKCQQELNNGIWQEVEQNV